MRRLTTVHLLVLVVLAAWTACSDTVVMVVPVSRIEVTPPELNLVPGQKGRLAAKVLGVDGEPLWDRSVTWHAGDASVLEVSSDGEVTAVGVGETFVRASIEGSVDSAFVSVGAGPAIGVGEDTVRFAASPGRQAEESVLPISNTGGGVLDGLEATVLYGPGARGWLSVSLSRTTAPAELTLRAVTSDVAPGRYEAALSVSSRVAANSPRTVPVTLEVSALAHLHLSLARDPDPVEAGERVTYRVEVTNSGPTAADDVVVEGAAPGELTFLDWDATAGTYEEESQRWKLGSVGEGSGATLTLEFRVDGDARAPFEYRAAVRSSTGDPDETDNRASVSTRVAQPPRPAGLEADVDSSDRIELRWKDASSNEEAFEVQRRTGGSGGWTTIATLPADTRAHSDDDVRDGTSYSYRVRATHGHSVSDWSDPAQATTPVAAPTNLRAIPVSLGRVRLSWRDNSRSETSYEVQRRNFASSGWERIAILSPGAESYSDERVVTILTYRYRVRAINSTGQSEWAVDSTRGD